MSSGVTVSGMDELKSAVERLPADVTAALRAVAQETARRVQAGARARWAALRQGGEESQLANRITVTEDLPNKQFIVRSDAPPGRPDNVPLWIEYGTVKMPARPYFGPAVRAEDARYQRDSAAAARAVVGGE